MAQQITIIAKALKVTMRIDMVTKIAMYVMVVVSAKHAMDEHISIILSD